MATSFGRLNRCPGWSGDQADLSLVGTSPGNEDPRFSLVLSFSSLRLQPLYLSPLSTSLHQGGLSFNRFPPLVHLHKAYPPPLSTSAHLKSFCRAGARSTDAEFIAVSEGRDRVPWRPLGVNIFLERKVSTDILRKRLQKNPCIWSPLSPFFTPLNRLLEEREVLLYCDFHGHSRKNNIFLYGCNSHDRKYWLHERVFPFMLSKNVPDKVST